MKRFQKNISMRKQRGAALLILAVILILTVTLVMMGKKSRNADKLHQQATVNKILQDAKEALITIAISHTTNPGALPYPDRFGDSIFDGGGDCNGQTAVAVNLPLRLVTPNNPLLGRFPHLDQAANAGGGGCTFIPIAHDMTQSPYPLHYVVSENLVEYNVTTTPATTNNINANVLTDPDLPSGWLTVFDGNGITLSNQVAFIIFYPGPPVAGQNRAPAGANAAQFLESFTVPGIGVVNNSNPISGNYVSANETATFNDKLVYVTANDLMRRVELTRIMNVMAANLTPPYPATLPAAAPFNTAPLTNWLGAGTNNYDAANDAPGGTGYNRTAITYSNTTDCNGNPGAHLQGVLQCRNLP